MKRLCLACAAFFGAISAPAVVLEFDGLQANQSLERVYDVYAGIEMDDVAIFSDHETDTAYGPVDYDHQLKSYRWKFMQRADVDGDGLLDVITAEIVIRGSAVLTESEQQSFSVRKRSGICKGDQFAMEVKHIRYTLATGESGDGRFKRFSGVRLLRSSPIRLNGKEVWSSETFHALNIVKSSLRIEPIGKQDWLPPIASISFQLEINSEESASASNEFGASSVVIFCFAPVLLILFRKPRLK